MANNGFYDKIDGVSMGSSLGPVSSNIIMTELEELVIRDLVLRQIRQIRRRHPTNGQTARRCSNPPVVEPIRS